MKEKPVRVVPGKSRRHKVETRIFSREIHETFCVHRGCKFYGKNAQQGICHTHKTFAGELDWSYIDSLFEQGEEYLKEYRKIHKGKEWSRFLENAVAMHWMMEVCSLDALIRLRRENGLLKEKLMKLMRAKLSHGKRAKRNVRDARLSRS